MPRHSVGIITSPFASEGVHAAGEPRHPPSRHSRESGNPRSLQGTRGRWRLMSRTPPYSGPGRILQNRLFLWKITGVARDRRVARRSGSGWRTENFGACCRVRRRQADERTYLAEKCARSERRGGRITRRWFLGALSAAGLVLTAALCCEPTSRTWASASLEGPGQARAFRTRPDLRPPVIKVNASSPDAAPGYIFVSPKKEPSGAGSEPGRTPDIDGSGEPVWFHPLRDSKVDDFNFEVQEYRGETVLT